MHARELVQLVASVAANAACLIHSREPFPEVATERYWTASKCRQEGWSRSLKDFAADLQDLSAPRGEDGYWIQPILEEVLTTEVLCRVWAAICFLADARRGTDEASPLAQNILAGHLEVRNRVLNLMVHGYGLRVEQAVALNRLRLRNERWTDTLLSFIGPQATRKEWAFEPQRVRSMARLLAHQDTGYGANLTKSLLLAAIAASYQSSSMATSPHAELNRRIACSIIACFPPHAFDSSGQWISVQQLWLNQGSPDTQGRIELVRPRGSSLLDSGGDSFIPPPIGDPSRRFDWQ